MSLVDDILTLVRKGPELLSQMDAFKTNTTSVAKGANASTFQFPCLVSDSISVDMATTLVRTLDKVYATFVQTWLSLHPTIDISLENPLQYIKKFHQNIKFENANDLIIDNDEIPTYMEKVYNGEYKLFINKDKTYGVLFNVADSATKEMMESHREGLREFLSDFDLSDFPNIGNSPYMNINEADDDFINSSDLAQSVIRSRIRKAENDERDMSLKFTDKLRTPQISDRDMKKANDVMPFPMQVRLMGVNDKGQFVQFMDFVIGVKAIMHIVKSNEIVENIARTLQNKNLFFKFLRWTSGEISLMKNIIFDIDNLRMDATNAATQNTPWLPTLKRLKGKKSVTSGLIPNATIVISSYEANYLKEKFGMDVKNPKIAKKIISSLFLMTFIVVDDASSTFEILYDGSDAYQTYSLETLEREISLNSNRLGREIGRMISK